MGRYQVNPIRKYFTFETSLNKSICQIVGCAARIAGNHGGNLQRHIEKKHPSTFLELQRLQKHHGLKRPAGDGGHTALHSVEQGEEEEEGAHEYDSAASASNISHYRPLTPPEITEQALSCRLKDENEEDLLSNDLPCAMKHDMVLKQFTDIMLADMQQIQDPLLLMKLRRDVTDLVFKAVEEDAKRSQIGNRKELYCNQMLPRFQMASEPCSSGAGPSTYSYKSSRKQRRAGKSQRMPTGGGGATGDEWRAGVCELNGDATLATHQVKTEAESLEEMEVPVYFSSINLEGSNDD